MIFKDIQIINSRTKIEQDHSKQNRKTHYRHFARSFKEVPVLNILDSIPLRKDVVAKQFYSRMTNSKCVDEKAETTPIELVQFCRQCRRLITVDGLSHEFLWLRWVTLCDQTNLNLFYEATLIKNTIERYYVIITKSTRPQQSSKRS